MVLGQSEYRIILAEFALYFWCSVRLYLGEEKIKISLRDLTGSEKSVKSVKSGKNLPRLFKFLQIVPGGCVRLSLINNYFQCFAT